MSKKGKNKKPRKKGPAKEKFPSSRTHTEQEKIAILQILRKVDKYGKRGISEYKNRVAKSVREKCLPADNEAFTLYRIREAHSIIDKYLREIHMENERIGNHGKTKH